MSGVFRLIRVWASRPIALLSLALACGCRGPAPYSGDGEIQHFRSRPHSGYYDVIHLGSVDLRETGSTTFRIRNAPAENYALEIAVPETLDGSRLSSAGVELTVVARSGDGAEVWRVGGDIGKRWAMRTSGTAPPDTVLLIYSPTGLLAIGRDEEYTIEAIVRGGPQVPPGTRAEVRLASFRFPRFYFNP